LGTVIISIFYLLNFMMYNNFHRHAAVVGLANLLHKGLCGGYLDGLSTLSKGMIVGFLGFSPIIRFGGE
jgi:hypothetical protein